jgi:hypothetical protein
MIMKHKETMDTKSKCLLPMGILFAVDSLKFKQNKVSSDSLNCFAMLLEAAVLYDQLLLYDYRPQGILYSLFGSDQLNKIGVENAIVELQTNADNFCKIIDPYEKLSEEGLTSIFKQSIESYLLKNGGVMGGSRAGKLKSSQKFSNILSIDVQNLVISSLESINDHDTFPSLQEKERNRFVKNYTNTHLWRIDQLRNLCVENSVDASYIMPAWEPFWMYERDNVRNALSEKFQDAQDVILSKYLRDTLKLDVSPLTIVALEKTKKADGLFETISIMRNDYKTLRLLYKDYSTSLRESKTYAEAADIISEWNSTWEKTIQKIAAPSLPLFRKLFSWDVLKQGSAISLFINSIELVIREGKNLSITERLSAIGKLEKDFLSAHRIESRLKDLFD